MLWGFLSLGLAVTLGCGADGGAGGVGGTGGVAGAGGTGGTGGAGTLQLVQTLPVDMATEVPTNIVVTAELDAALNEATVTTSSFTLTRDGGADVEGSVAVTEQIANFTPARPLGLLSSYTATLTTAIESVSGQTLAMTQTWGFQTRDGQWGEPVLIEISNADSAFFPQVAVDPNGNAVARLAPIGWDAREHLGQSVRVGRANTLRRQAPAHEPLPSRVQTGSARCRCNPADFLPGRIFRPQAPALA